MDGQFWGQTIWWLRQRPLFAGDAQTAAASPAELKLLPCARGDDIYQESMLRHYPLVGSNAPGCRTSSYCQNSDIVLSSSDAWFLNKAPHQ